MMTTRMTALLFALMFASSCSDAKPSSSGTSGDTPSDDGNSDDHTSSDPNSATAKPDGGTKPATATKDAAAPAKGSPGTGTKLDAGGSTSSKQDAASTTQPDDGGVSAQADDAGTGTTQPTSGGSLPAVDSVEKDGPFATTIDKNAGANSWVFRPMELGKGGVKHPVFVWGTGATASPNDYAPDMPRVASHGFIVISPNSTMVSAAMLKASLDWILAQNDVKDSMYYQKIDTSKVAMGGHSLGSVGTFDAEAMETRLTTSIHIAGGSFDGMGSSKVKTPTAYICGGNGDIAAPQCATDFMNATKPTFYSVLTGVGHVDAFKNALPGMIAWLRWHLAGETERKAMFTGPDGDFFKGIWKSQTKNW